MTILITALALAAAPAATAQPTPAAPPAAHAHHAQPAPPGAKPQGEGCSCCKKMADGGKMECCAKPGQEAGEHSGH
ncbi:MAG TPA: hypothetical protein VFS45_00305 [Sphingomicrobium sp.]|nr:hypothetical protein [Sphingomicrobium sp.]